MGQIKQFYQFIPEKFNYLTKSKTVEHNGIRLKTSYLINIIHELILKYYFSNKKYLDFDDKKENIKFNLWSIILRRKYGAHYNTYIDYLVECGFMTLVSNYYASKKSKTYKINYFNLDSIKRVVVNDTILSKKSSREYLEQSFTSYCKSPIDSLLRKRLLDDLYHIKIDYDKSIELLNNLKNNGKIELNKYYRNHTSVDSIKNGYLFFKFDEYGRFHSNYTILKKEIRQNFLKIDDEEITEIDIINSQPLFLSVLLKDSSVDQNDDEIENFNWITKNGLFYDYISSHFSGMTRSEIKLLTYKVLFGHNGIKSTESKIFKSIFPKIYDKILEYKTTNGDYRYLAHTLQRMESDFVFGKVVKEIYEKIPKIRLFTVHDSIIFPLKYKKEVSEIFKGNLDELCHHSSSP